MAKTSNLRGMVLLTVRTHGTMLCKKML